MTSGVALWIPTSLFEKRLGEKLRLLPPIQRQALHAVEIGEQELDMQRDRLPCHFGTVDQLEFARKRLGEQL